MWKDRKTWIIGGLICVFSIIATSLSFIHGTTDNRQELLTQRFCVFLLLFFQISVPACLVFFLCYRYTHRVMPNMAIAAAWTLLVTVFVDSIFGTPYNPLVTVVDVVADAYQYRGLKGEIFTTILKLYGVGLFGTILLSLGPEIAKSLWSDEFRSTDNKTLLAKFNRDRRALLLRVVFKNRSCNILYIWLGLYGIVFVAALLTVMATVRRATVTFSVDLIMLFLSVSLEGVGIFSHSVISDSTLFSAERAYLQRNIKSLPRWMKKTNFENAETVINFAQVLVNTYCNHGLNPFSHTDVFEKLSQVIRDMKNGDMKAFLFVLFLIQRFDETKTRYIDPIDEQYWKNTRRDFETQFAADVDGFLSGLTKPIENVFPENYSEAVSLANQCFFTKQNEQWKEWFYINGAPYQETAALLMLDYLRLKFLSSQNAIDAVADASETDYGALLMEFPYIMESCILNRFGKPGETEKNENPELTESCFHLFSTEDPPQYRERVEQYYAELFKSKCNKLNKDFCQKIAARFQCFLTHSYETKVRKERFLHRIFPINSNNFTATNDRPDASIVMTAQLLCAIDKNSYNNPAPGWNEIVKDEVEKCGQSKKESRLCYYDVLNYQKKDPNYATHDWGVGLCCNSRDEQCRVMAAIMFHVCI